MQVKNILIVGGNPDEGKHSKILEKVYDCFSKEEADSVEIYNATLPKNFSGSDLIIWMPDIANEKPKDYPIKDKGAVLICSKVMRPGYYEFEAISRIFRMNGNAVIAIYQNDPKEMQFKLIDALGNTWCDTTSIQSLCETICQLFSWTKSSIRKSLKARALNSLPSDVAGIFERNEENLKKFIELNNLLAVNVQTAVGKRFFGNLSTRCMKLFPSKRNGDYIFVSPRNIDKSKLSAQDFIIVNLPEFTYFGERKPSVDTPVQCSLYAEYPEINYMIHGHAYLREAPFTKNYFPCGDLREFLEISSVWGKKPSCINLKNHGFLITSKTLEELEAIIADFHVISL